MNGKLVRAISVLWCSHCRIHCYVEAPENCRHGSNTEREEPLWMRREVEYFTQLHTMDEFNSTIFPMQTPFTESCVIFFHSSFRNIHRDSVWSQHINRLIKIWTHSFVKVFSNKLTFRISSLKAILSWRKWFSNSASKTSKSNHNNCFCTNNDDITKISEIRQ